LVLYCRELFSFSKILKWKIKAKLFFVFLYFGKGKYFS
jgi:hypothetical protein